VRGNPLRVDLLTPGTADRPDPVSIPRFRAAAAPIEHLSLLIDDAQPAAAIHAKGAILVVVPTPARLALHKLWVSQTRSVTQHTKSGKDLHQAALLLEVLAEDRPDDLDAAASAVAKRGPSVSSKVLRALALAEKRWPAAAEGSRRVREVLEP